MACSKDQTNNGNTLSSDAANQLEVGDAPDLNDPVHPNDTENPNFDQYLKPFPTLLAKEEIQHSNTMTHELLYSVSAEDLFEWIKINEGYYQSALTAQLAYSEEQREKLEQWLSQYLSDELIEQRLNHAMHPVEGGYRVQTVYSVYDFNVNHIEEVVNLDLKQEDHFISLTAELIVKVEQPIRVTYKISEVDGVIKLTGYEFSKLDDKAATTN